MTYPIILEENASTEDISRIGEGIDRHADALFPDKSVGTITFFVRDESGEIVGGAVGKYINFGWLYIDALWVSEDLRGQGYGTRLMQMIEAEGVRQGSKNVYLNTFSFEAPEFYKKLGYTVFAELEDFPPGHSRLFLRKKLANQ